MTDGTPQWDYVIQPKRKWFDIDLRGLWHYRDLCLMYVKRNFITTYKQTILGPAWFVIQPLFTIIMYMFIFGRLAGIPTSGNADSADIPQQLFYMAGILLWNYFADCFGSSNNVFVSNHQVFGKVYFPRFIVPLSGIITCLIKLSIQTVVLFVMYIWYYNPTFSVNWSLLMFPVLVFVTAFLGMSLGLVVSSVTYKYRDLQLLVGFAMQMLMYATPIVYPLAFVHDKAVANGGMYVLLEQLIRLNPMTSILEAFKYGCFTTTGILDWWGLLYSFVFMAVLTVGSVLLFNKVERNFMDCV